MSGLPRVSGREVVKALQEVGYARDRPRGSHIVLRRAAPPHRRITVPDHGEVAKGTLRVIIRQAGLTVDDWSALMSDRPQGSRSAPHDAAALAAAALAGALASLVVPGPYGLFSVVIGVTLLFVIFAFEHDRRRDTFQSIAFGAVTAFVSLLIVGFVLELIAGGGHLYNLGECPKPSKPCPPDKLVSRVTRGWEWGLVISWVAISVIVALVDRSFFQKWSRRRSAA